METSVLVDVAACLLVILILRWLSEGRRKPPGPWSLPIVGYIPFLSRMPHLDLQRLAKKYGNVFSIRLGNRYAVVLNDFDSTKDAFNQDAFMGRPDDTTFDINRETIETKAITGLPYKFHRRFSLHQLRDLGFGKTWMEGHIQDEINKLLEHYETNVGKPFFAQEYLAPSMSNNIGSLVFGKRLKYSDPTRQWMTTILKDAGRIAGQVTWQLFLPWLKNIFRILGLGGVDRMDQISQEYKTFVMKEINEHEATLNPSNIRDYIDAYLLEIQKRKDDPTFCKAMLQDMAGIFFNAGSETVRISLEWLILTVASDQAAQRRIQAEIDDVIGQNRLPITSDQKSMPFTEAFIMELLRWRTIVPINVLRYTIKDTELNGYFIPKHSQVLSNLWAIHHDKEYWGKDAEEFRPERFMTEDGKEFKKWDHFIPFSIGKRSCPGEPLARIEIFLYFVSILQRFEIKLPDGKMADFEGELGINLQPKAYEVVMTKRH